MKIIEAMKRVKLNKVKIADLRAKIAPVCANLSFETPLYGAETDAKITEWLQSCTDLSQENVRLLTAIARTNLKTPVTISIGDKQVTKSIAEWVWRRREYALIDLQTWAAVGDRGLKEGSLPNPSGGEPQKVSIVRHYSPDRRDQMVAAFKEEPAQIDSMLEVVNAITDLDEAA